MQMSMFKEDAKGLRLTLRRLWGLSEALSLAFVCLSWYYEP